MSTAQTRREQYAQIPSYAETGQSNLNRLTAKLALYEDLS
jgi:hypothetical protein